MISTAGLVVGLNARRLRYDAAVPSLRQAREVDIPATCVRRSARRRDLGVVLMDAVERAAQDAGRILLARDTTGDTAERLFARLR